MSTTSTCSRAQLVVAILNVAYSTRRYYKPINVDVSESCDTAASRRLASTEIQRPFNLKIVHKRQYNHGHAYATLGT